MKTGSPKINLRIKKCKFYSLFHNPHEYISLAKQQLDPGNNELKDTGFISKFNWSENGKEDWLIYYWPPVCVRTCTGREEEEKIESIKIKQKEEENKKRQEEIKKIEQIYNSLDPLQQEEIRIETENQLPDFWKENFNKERVKGKTSKMLEVVLEEKRREIIKEWIDSGRIEDINSK